MKLSSRNKTETKVKWSISKYFILMVSASIVFGTVLAYRSNSKLFSKSTDPSKITTEPSVSTNPTLNNTNKPAVPSSTPQSTAKPNTSPDWVERCSNERPISHTTEYIDVPSRPVGEETVIAGWDGAEKTCEYPDGRTVVYRTKEPYKTTIYRGTKTTTFTPTPTGTSYDSARQSCQAITANGPGSAFDACMNAYGY